MIRIVSFVASIVVGVLTGLGYIVLEALTGARVPSPVAAAVTAAAFSWVVFKTAAKGGGDDT
ncbi:MAG: hypothetical protein Q4F02_03465 [Candidatus Saccharibacteria bacterium]|nr:hypothetical protein [Candidatus Saccharibacteria bacterium]